MGTGALTWFASMAGRLKNWSEPGNRRIVIVFAISAVVVAIGNIIAAVFYYVDL